MGREQDVYVSDRLAAYVAVDCSGLPTHSYASFRIREYGERTWQPGPATLLTL